MRQPRHLSWSISTMPSSSRLYTEPDGQDATHVGLRQCSHRRGKYIMKVFSNVPYISFCMLSNSLSLLRWANSPPRSSSQFGPHSIFSIFFPVSTEMGRAVGGVCDSGALCRCS